MNYHTVLFHYILSPYHPKSKTVTAELKLL